jgi:predicted RNase H-like HicB family nuclease
MKFAIILEQDEDGFIIASCPALPGCHSQGRTKAEAIDSVWSAMRFRPIEKVGK